MQEGKQEGTKVVFLVKNGDIFTRCIGPFKKCNSEFLHDIAFFSFILSGKRN